MACAAVREQASGDARPTSPRRERLGGFPFSRSFGYPAFAGKGYCAPAVPGRGAGSSPGTIPVGVEWTLQDGTPDPGGNRIRIEAPGHDLPCRPEAGRAAV